MHPSAGAPERPPAPSSAAEDGLWSHLRGPTGGGRLHREGDELVGEDGRRWPIVRGVPRFVPSDQYVGSFSFEWNTHRTTQVDVHTGATHSADALQEKTGLTREQVEGKLVLDAGVGAGRYSDVLSRWGARVIGVDLSYAVEAAQQNLGGRENVLVAQADIFDLPFAPGTFDLIISIGVLHHTPDTRAAFERLVQLLKPGGEICIWVYPDSEHYTVRQAWVPWIRRIPPRWFHSWCRWFVPRAQARIGNPLVRYTYQLFPWSFQAQGLENDILDTFDAYSPYYHWVHGEEEVLGWFRAAGLVELQTFSFRTAVRGRKPLAPATR